MKSLQIIIVYNEKHDENSEKWLNLNLQDMVWSLNNVLKRNNDASSSAIFETGKVVLDVEGADRATVEPYMVSFLSSMEREGFNLTLTYREI